MTKARLYPVSGIKNPEYDDKCTLGVLYSDQVKKIQNHQSRRKENSNVQILGRRITGSHGPGFCHPGQEYGEFQLDIHFYPRSGFLRLLE